MYISGRGSAAPLGATVIDGLVNFSVFAEGVEEVGLRVDDTQEFLMERTGPYFHLELGRVSLGSAYSFLINGKEYCDPYARALRTARAWGKGTAHPTSVVVDPEPFDWQGVRSPNHPREELVIYELSVRGFGESFLGVIDKIPYLRSLGINAIEIMPVMEFNETEAKPCNFWGYSPLHFFSPMGRFAIGTEVISPEREFQRLVRACHAQGIEVILDVVFNHTGERDPTCPTSSWRGLAPKTYYLDRDYTGCGNTLNANHPVTADLIMASLRHWVQVMRVDGFRFDLASILARGPDGTPLVNPPILERIANDPVLAHCKLIAEPWDAVGLYQVGAFAPHQPRWTEWNDRFRDDVRRFLKGEPLAGAMATRLAGSEDVYREQGSPLCSLNYVTAHDGFTLRDLVTYQVKDNEANGEGNRDGAWQNHNWNCGVEGASDSSEVLALRSRQQRNHLLALFVAQGIPMLTMGDERGHSKFGNNNSWCQEEINVLNWGQIDSDLLKYTRALIALRKQCPLLRRNRFLTAADVTWHDPHGAHHNWRDNLNFLGMYLRDPEGKQDLYVVFNACAEAVTVSLPPAKHPWAPLLGGRREMLPYSSALFVASPVHAAAYGAGPAHAGSASHRQVSFAAPFRDGAAR